MRWRWAALAGAFALSLPLVAGFFGAWHPAFDSFAHFRLHLAALLALAALPALAMRGLRLNGLAALALAVGAAASTGALPGATIGPVEASVRPDPESRAVYRLLQLNLRFDNATPEKVIALIGRTEPDVVTLDEVSDGWAARLEMLAARYPHRVVCDPGSEVGGVAILSRRPFAAGASGACHGGGAMAVARLDFGGPQVTVAALHLRWPWPFGQPGQIAALAPALADTGGTALIAGDFNATPWSAAAANVAAAAGARRVPGSGATWLWRRLPVALRPYLGLPIDHVLVKGPLEVHGIEAGGWVGSDHAPVLVAFSLAPDGRPAPQEGTTAMAALGGTAGR